MTRIIINAAIASVGGGVQASASIINELMLMKTKDILYLVSPSVFNELDEELLQNNTVKIVSPSPNKLNGLISILKIRKIVREFKPGVFITLFGPTYFHPGKTIHIVGFAQGWLIYDNKLSLNLMNMKDRIKRHVLNIIQSFFFKYNTDAFVVETDDVKNRVMKKFNVSDEFVFVNSNTVSGHFIEKHHFPYEFNRNVDFDSEDVKLLSIAYPYPHKNLNIIKDVIEFLPKNYKFIVTMPDDIFHSIFPSESKQIINIGRVNNIECPSLYDFCDGVFLPSLIECFSCNYVEAFFSKKPLFTSNLSFATSLCGDSAFYFNPTDAKNIAETIISGFNNPDEIERKVMNGYNILSGLPSPSQRAIYLLDFAKSLLK